MKRKAHSKTDSGEFSPDEYRQIAEKLDSYGVEFPGEQEMAETLRLLGTHMPPPAAPKTSYRKRLLELLQQVGSEALMFRKLYWLACGGLLLLGFWLGTGSADDPYWRIFMFIPLPFLLGLLEIFKSRDQGLLEIELTCKISAQQLLLARLIVVLACNMAVVALLAAMAAGSGGAGGSEGAGYWSTVCFWYAQMLLAAGVSLWLALRVKGGTAVAVFLSAWILLMVIVMGNVQAARFLRELSPLVLAAMLGGGLLLLLSQMRRAARKYTFYGERGVQYDLED